jgi:hypothetical protein
MKKRNSLAAWALAVICFAGIISCGDNAMGQDVFFRRGDVNEDGTMDLSDAVFIIERLFVVQEPIVCSDSADATDDGVVDVSDVVKITAYLFLGFEPPPPPFSECGLDPTEDELGCESFAPCDSDEPSCIDETIAEGLVGEIDFKDGLSICLPAGGAALPAEGFEVEICPVDDAPAECGDTGKPGCPIEILGATAIADFDEGRIGLRIEGRVEALPIAVTEGFLNTTTTCTLTLHSAEGEDVPFNFEIIVPLEIEENEDGQREIVAIGEAGVENPDVEVTTAGGFLCSLFGAAGDGITDLLLEPFAETVNQLVDSLREDLVGVEICE